VPQNYSDQPAGSPGFPTDAAEQNIGLAIMSTMAMLLAPKQVYLELELFDGILQSADSVFERLVIACVAFVRGPLGPCAPCPSTNCWLCKAGPLIPFAFAFTTL